jgi:Domain of unknown function (DUF1877)
MSIICTYIRCSPAQIEALSEAPEVILDEERCPAGVEVIDIDKAYEALAWLVSPLKRAQVSHLRRLINEPAWPNAEARASVANLNSMPMDDAYVAIEGRARESIDAINFGLGGAAHFAPERVSALSKAISMLSEASLRAQLDFAAMDENDVTPGPWVEEGEDTFRSYLLPALRRLQGFYASASANGQAVLVVRT